MNLRKRQAANAKAKRILFIVAFWYGWALSCTSDCGQAGKSFLIITYA